MCTMSSDQSDPSVPLNNQQTNGALPTAGARTATGNLQQLDFCEYCGARLNAVFYFCTSCGTPYKSFETVLPPSRPAPLTDEQLVHRKAPAVARVFWIYVAVVLCSAWLSHTLLGDAQLELQLLILDATMFITTCIVGGIYWRSLKAQLKVFGFNHWAACVGLAALIPLLAINWLYHDVIPQALGADFEDDLAALASLGRGVLVVSICILPAITEEIAFRGLVQHWLQVALAPWKAVVLAAGLFTALHFSMYSFPYLFGVGCLLGWVRLKTGSLYPCILIHLLHNWAVVEWVLANY